MVKEAVNLKIFSLIFAYQVSLSFSENEFRNVLGNLTEILSYCHRILILLSKYFMNKIIEEPKTNLWVNKLKQLLEKYDQKEKTNQQIFRLFQNFTIKLKNTIEDNLYNNIDFNLNHNNIHNINRLKNIFANISNFAPSELNTIYREEIHQNLNENGSIFASSLFFKNRIPQKNFNTAPFLPKFQKLPYTLVLDLDETLIHLKLMPGDSSSGVLKFRPFLFDFLKEIKKFYELVVFTAATQDYADPIIDTIEEKMRNEKGIMQTFDQRLYRNHTTVIENDFVKDLSKFGRNLGRIIIVDNMKQNYKLQKDNGITIRPFWGKDTDDLALYDLLPILVNIAINNLDVRLGLKMYYEQILSKVSSNIFRREHK